VSPSNGIPVAVPAETSSNSNIPSTTVKILIPPSSSDDSEEDDAVIIEAGNGTFSPLPREPFHPGDCFLENAKGPCRAIIDMWFFNTENKMCEQFQYSGCGGNGNRFSDEVECNNYCGKKNNEKGASDDDDDTVIIEPGMSNNETCPEFDGCGPLKCAVLTDENGCKKCACSVLPGDDSEEGKPSVGSVSGKPSEDDEERVKNGKDVCGLPELRGDCRAMVTRYRYDSKTKTCIMFHFGGCNSNGNNFVSEEKCMEFCKGE